MRGVEQRVPAAFISEGEVRAMLPTLLPTYYPLLPTTHYVPPTTYSLLSTQVRFMLPTSDFREAGEARVQLSLNGQQFDGGEPLSFQYHHAVQCTLM